MQGRGQTADELAFNRNERELKKFLLRELPIGDFVFTIVRQVLLDTYHYHLFDRLQQSIDPTLAAIAAKVVKRVRTSYVTLRNSLSASATAPRKVGVVSRMRLTSNGDLPANCSPQTLLMSLPTWQVSGHV